MSESAPVKVFTVMRLREENEAPAENGMYASLQNTTIAARLAPLRLEIDKQYSLKLDKSRNNSTEIFKQSIDSRSLWI